MGLGSIRVIVFVALVIRPSMGRRVMRKGQANHSTPLEAESESDDYTPPTDYNNVIVAMLYEYEEVLTVPTGTLKDLQAHFKELHRRVTQALRVSGIFVFSLTKTVPELKKALGDQNLLEYVNQEDGLSLIGKEQLTEADITPVLLERVSRVFRLGKFPGIELAQVLLVTHTAPPQSALEKIHTKQVVQSLTVEDMLEITYWREAGDVESSIEKQPMGDTRVWVPSGTLKHRRVTPNSPLLQCFMPKPYEQCSTIGSLPQWWEISDRFIEDAMCSTSVFFTKDDDNLYSPYVWNETDDKTKYLTTLMEPSFVERFFDSYGGYEFYVGEIVNVADEGHCTILEKDRRNVKLRVSCASGEKWIAWPLDDDKEQQKRLKLPKLLERGQRTFRKQDRVTPVGCCMQTPDGNFRPVFFNDTLAGGADLQQSSMLQLIECDA